MVKEIKAATAKTLSTADRVWNVILLLAQGTAATLGAVFSMELDNPHRAIVVAVSCILAANVVLTLFRLQKETH